MDHDAFMEKYREAVTAITAITAAFEYLGEVFKEIGRFILDNKDLLFRPLKKKTTAPKKILSRRFILSKRFKIIHCRNNC